MLLFFFAVLNVIFAVALFATGEEAAVGAGTINVVQALVYAVLGLLIKRGSFATLIFTGVLFAIDTVLTVVGPWESARGILGRALLIFVLVRYLHRERRAFSRTRTLTC